MTAIPRTVRGRVWVVGDHVDTDVIIPARYLTTSDPQELARHVFEDLDPSLRERIRPGDIVVAGVNFGSGSSREHAPIALKAAGIACVVARSFARIFYRNAVNVGLPVLQCPEPIPVQSGQTVSIDLEAGTVLDEAGGRTFVAERMPDVMREILEAGGLVPYVARRLQEREASARAAG
ncbi:MAG: 3-isopropylmalate dehydratase small subunit [Limnochordaceae bacterium]|nr:3-isopropylmalate dehydratase small subunit [Limnochordaceae bacterium]